MYRLAIITAIVAGYPSLSHGKGPTLAGEKIHGLPDLIRAVDRLQARIDELERRLITVNALSARIGALESEYSESGGLYVTDANGTEVGPYIGVSAQNIIAFDESVGGTMMYGLDGQPVSAWTLLYFLTADCTGTPYAPMPSGIAAHVNDGSYYRSVYEEYSPGPYLAIQTPDGVCNAPDAGNWPDYNGPFSAMEPFEPPTYTPPFAINAR